MKFILNQTFKKSRTWGTYYVKVFMDVSDKWVTNCTEEIAGVFWYNIKDWLIVISHWSWTGVMVIAQRLNERFWEVAQIIDISI